MKTVLLTTETTHHLYFADMLSRDYPLEAIILENRKTIYPFQTEHLFEKDREKYEQEIINGQCKNSFSEVASTIAVKNANENESLTLLSELKPDIIIVFGTGKLKQPVIGKAALACLNLHGGNPEEYRGLDTHLWSIYHDDFDNLVTTLHHVDPELDTGDIVFQSRVAISNAPKLYMLRFANTLACLDLTRIALNTLNLQGRLPARNQLKRGRYYSCMPESLKQLCVDKYERYMRTK